MANMSYCRFENTSRDLQDCVAALDELADGAEFIRPLSTSERQSADWMVKLCQRYLELHSELVQSESEAC
jgi:hypothetical protein